MQRRARSGLSSDVLWRAVERVGAKIVSRQTIPGMSSSTNQKRPVTVGGKVCTISDDDTAGQTMLKTTGVHQVKLWDLYKVKNATLQWSISKVLIPYHRPWAHRPMKPVMHGQHNARPTVTFLGTEHNCLLSGTNYTAWWWAQGVNNLPRVVTQQCPDHESNPQPFGGK